jgi:hypothetical protein
MCDTIMISYVRSAHEVTQQPALAASVFSYAQQP